MIARKFLISLLASLSLMGILSNVAYAQTQDGALGATSTGQVDLDLEVTDSVEISALTAIDFGSYGGGDTGGIQEEIGFCVYVNGGDGYTITPSSANGDFILIGDNGQDEIEYTVKLAGSGTGAASQSAVAYENQSATFLGSVRRDCNGTNNASLDVSIEEQEIRDASTDTYADTLILLVNPV